MFQNLKLDLEKLLKSKTIEPPGLTEERELKSQSKLKSFVEGKTLEELNKELYIDNLYKNKYISKKYVK